MFSSIANHIVIVFSYLSKPNLTGMKKHFLFVFFSLAAIMAFGQGNFKVVQQQQAQYPGGMQALQDYYNQNMTYTEEAKSHRIYGEVMLSVDVMPDSTLTNIIVLQGQGYGIDEEVVRLLKPMKFSPAVSNNVVIRSNIIISINVKAIPDVKLEIEYR